MRRRRSSRIPLSHRRISRGSRGSNPPLGYPHRGIRSAHVGKSRHVSTIPSPRALPPNAHLAALADCPAIHTVRRLGHGHGRVPCCGWGSLPGGAAPLHITSTATPQEPAAKPQRAVAVSSLGRVAPARRSTDTLTHPVFESARRLDTHTFSCIPPHGRRAPRHRAGRRAR